ncbi:MAG: DnaJ C-terminal domain-containing protein [Bacteroidota bacterium]
MDYKDYYKTLGVGRKSSTEEIRKAYRKLAMQYHPDRNPGDKSAEERFKEINEAYQVLSDSEKRARYDQLGSAYSNWQQRGGTPNDFDWSQWFSGQPEASGGGTRVDYGEVNDIFSDFFRSIFGGEPAARRGGRRGAAPAYEQPVEISLKEAYEGTTRQLQTEARRVKVRIPPGVRTGSKVRVAGAGPQGLDLYLVVEVQDEDRFERRNNDLHTTATVDIFTALLGGEAEVQTMAGKVRLSIPAGTQPEQVFRIAGRGMPQLKDPNVKGDLYVRLKVQIPKYLSPKQRELLEEASKLKF